MGELDFSKGEKRYKWQNNLQNQSVADLRCPADMEFTPVAEKL
jgi:hypothetical protein